MLALALMLLTAAGALAETVGAGPAVLWAAIEGDFVDMHEAADEGSALLMCYYDGTVCDVREIAGDWARVRVGSETIYLQGYVRTDSLRGVEAMRERGWSCGWVDYFETGVPFVVYAACDAHAKVLRREQGEYPGSETVCGINGEWAQLSARNVYYGDERRDILAGFIRLEGLTVTQDTSASSEVYPAADDMTYAQAYDRAIAHMVENADYLTRFEEDERTEEALRALTWEARLRYNRETGERYWWVVVEDAQDIDRNAFVYMEPDGTLIRLAAANG